MNFKRGVIAGFTAGTIGAVVVVSVAFFAEGINGLFGEFPYMSWGLFIVRWWFPLIVVAAYLALSAFTTFAPAEKANFTAVFIIVFIVGLLGTEITYRCTVDMTRTYDRTLFTDVYYPLMITIPPPIFACCLILYIHHRRVLKRVK